MQPNNSMQSTNNQQPHQQQANIQAQQQQMNMINYQVPNNQNVSKNKQQMNQVNQKYKSQLCRHYEGTGNCQMGDKCHFAHGQAELRDPSAPIPEEAKQFASARVTPSRQYQNQGRGGMMNNNNRQQQQNNGGNGNFSSNFKTVKCKFFEAGKTCPYSERCSFAHGDTELRPQQNQQQMNNGQQQLMQQNPNALPMPAYPTVYGMQQPNQDMNQLAAQQQAFMMQPQPGMIMDPSLLMAYQMPYMQQQAIPQAQAQTQQNTPDANQAAALMQQQQQMYMMMMQQQQQQMFGFNGQQPQQAANSQQQQQQTSDQQQQQSQDMQQQQNQDQQQ